MFICVHSRFKHSIQFVLFKSLMDVKPICSRCAVLVYLVQRRVVGLTEFDVSWIYVSDEDSERSKLSEYFFDGRPIIFEGF